MTDRLEDESAWAAPLYTEADARVESKETMKVRLNSRLVKERLAVGFSWIISTQQSDFEILRPPVPRGLYPISCSLSLHHKDASPFGRAPLDFGIGAVISASLRLIDLWPIIRKYWRYYRLIVRFPGLWCDAVRPIEPELHSEGYGDRT